MVNTDTTSFKQKNDNKNYESKNKMGIPDLVYKEMLRMQFILYWRNWKKVENKTTRTKTRC